MQITKNIFSFNLQGTGSEMIFGGYDKTLIGKPSIPHIGDADHIVWMRLHESETWSLTLNDFRIGADGGSSVDSTGYKAIVDTGSSMILLPTDLWKKYTEVAKKWKGVSC
jgi:hypothetical protein